MKKLALALFALAACQNESPTPAAATAAASAPAPSATGAPSATASAVTTATATVAATAPATPPVSAEFVEISAAKPLRVEHVACEQRAIAVVSGSAKAPAGALQPGDWILSRGKGTYDITGAALVVSARTGVGQACDATKTPEKVEAKILKANAARDLAFADKKMHAHLDADDRAVAPFAYVGRLEGTAPVAEHAHDGSWEVLCAYEAAGTFTLAGSAARLSPKTCVTVPPNTKHAWAPDTNTALRAFQIYEPPGPEQRFKALAAKEK